MATKTELEDELQRLRQELDEARQQVAAATEKAAAKGVKAAKAAVEDAPGVPGAEEIERLLSDFAVELKDLPARHTLLLAGGALIVGYMLGRAR